MTTPADTVTRRRALQNRTAGSARGGGASVTLPSVLVWLFIVFLTVPIVFYAGTLRLSFYRVMLLVMFLPCLWLWLSGKCGRVRAPDILLIFLVAWIALSLAINRGVGFTIVPAGILFLETFGAYLLARCLVRDAAAFEGMARALFTVILVLLPFAAFEAVTDRAVLIEIFQALFEVHPFVQDRFLRWGLRRVQGPFEHPILFGVFCSAGFALSLYVLGYGKGVLARFVKPGLVGMAVFFSLSSGPLTTMLAQGAVALVERVTRRVPRRWPILFSGLAAVYIMADIFSNRSPIEAFVARIAFNPATAFARVRIWRWGLINVVNRPLFGTGADGWERPSWMGGSMDMFWMVIAVRYGLPAVLSFSLAVLLVLISVGRLQIADPRLASYRLGFVVTMVGLILAGWTVHFWNATYVLFMFLLGSGVWMLDADGESAAGGRGTREVQPNSGRSRKPVKHRAQPTSRSFSPRHR